MGNEEILKDIRDIDQELCTCQNKMRIEELEDEKTYLINLLNLNRGVKNE